MLWCLCDQRLLVCALTWHQMRSCPVVYVFLVLCLKKERKKEHRLPHLDFKLFHLCYKQMGKEMGGGDTSEHCVWHIHNNTDIVNTKYWMTQTFLSFGSLPSDTILLNMNYLMTQNMFLDVLLCLKHILVYCDTVLLVNTMQVFKGTPRKDAGWQESTVKIYSFIHRFHIAGQ